MRPLTSSASVFLAFAAFLVIAGVATRSPARDLVPPGEIYGSVSLRSDVQPDGSIIGVLKNSGAVGVRDVRLLVQHAWLWNDERNPGPPQSNPGRSAYYVVNGDIPPGGELRFRYAPTPPLPVRTDGHFVTTASIVGLTEF